MRIAFVVESDKVVELVSYVCVGVVRLTHIGGLGFVDSSEVTVVVKDCPVVDDISSVESNSVVVL